jgi:diacylglycerol kinase family enzyme
MTGSGSGGGGDGRTARLLARASVLCAVGSLAVLVATAGLRSALVIVAGLVGTVVMATGVWWALTHHGAVRVLGALLAVTAPIAVVVLYAGNDLWPPVLAAMALWAAALACGRAALRRDRPPRTMRDRPAGPLRRPVLIMNPRSGGGKVERFGLVAKAEALGASVVLLDPSEQQDVTEIARRAVADGADLLGVAGGDGTQALVAAVAAQQDVPFLVIPAGTRNHLAMDLGLDRSDPALSLDALTDGVELRIDLGRVAGRAFVNSVSFGVYAAIVQDPAYRDAKAATALAAMPDLLLGYTGARLTARAGGEELTDPQAVLVSNNPYAAGDLLAAGRRPRLDGGTLGVFGVKVAGVAQAAELALRGGQAEAVTVLAVREVEVTADAASIPVAVDGEALVLNVPVRCAISPGALRVRVPRDRPGTQPALPPLGWRRVGRLALGRTPAQRAAVADA